MPYRRRRRSRWICLSFLLISIPVFSVVFTSHFSFLSGLISLTPRGLIHSLYHPTVLQAAALDEARREAQTAAKSFDQVRQARHDAFSAAFSLIASSINNIYQELTRSTVHKLGENHVLRHEIICVTR